MVKNRAGVSFKDITIAAIMGEENQHLPTYLDKIRPSEQISEEKKDLALKYINRNSADDSRQPPLVTKSQKTFSSNKQTEESQKSKRSKALEVSASKKEADLSSLMVGGDSIIKFDSANDNLFVQFGLLN